MSANKNPYARGNYFAMFAFWQTECKGIVTKTQLVSYGTGKLGMTETAAVATATVMLSPREVDSDRGDCRGNFSAQGHVYFAQPLNKVKGEDRKYRLRFRKEELERRVRPDVAAAAKPAKKAKPVKAPAKAPAKKKSVKKVKKVETPVVAPETSAPADTAAPAETVAAPETPVTAE